MGLGDPRFGITKADGKYSSAFLCGLITVVFFDQESWNE